MHCKTHILGSMLRQYELVEKVRRYDPDADEALINRAYVFSMKAHGSQLRACGDPYFSHPIEVAGILTDLKLDDETIATGILHDTDRGYGGNARADREAGAFAWRARSVRPRRCAARFRGDRRQSCILRARVTCRRAPVLVTGTLTNYG